MKTFTNYFKKLIPLSLTIGSVLLFISCGTHNNNDYEADGIYAPNKTIIVKEDTSTLEEDKNNYYKQYFKTKELTYKGISEEDAIITDIEAYHTSESLDEDGYVVIEETEYDEGYGAWGSNSTEVSINVYGGYGYSPYYYGGYWGFSYGWGHPYFGYGWGYPYYGYGWGYPYYGYGWGYPYYGYGGYPYYSNYGYGYAYNRGRRNTAYAGRTAYNRTNSYTRGRTSYSSNRRTISSNRRSSYSRLESNRRSTLRGNNTRPSNARPSSNSSSVNRRSTTRRSSNYNRPSTNSRPSSSYRSSSSRSSSSRGGSSGSRASSGRRGGR